MKAVKSIIIISILRYFFILLNKHIHLVIDYDGWVDYFYIPAGFNVIALLIYGYEGAVGIAIGSLIWNLFNKSSDIFVGIGLSIMPFVSCSIAYYIYYQFIVQNRNQEWHAPSFREVVLFSLIYAVMNSVLHHVAFPFILKLENFSIISFVKMFVGDLSGALFVFIIFNILTSFALDVIGRAPNKR